MSKVVQAVLIVAAAAIAIFEGLTNMVGFVFAALGFVGLIAAAIIIGFATRPARSPAVPAKLTESKTEKAESVEAPAPKPKPPESTKPEPRPGPVLATTPAKPPAAAPAKTQPAVAPSYRATDMMKVGVRIGEEVRKSEGIRPPAASPPPEKPRQFKEDRIRRRVEIRAGRVTTVKLPVVKGNYVYGRLWEKDGFDFTWAIVDPKALGLMERGAVFLAQRFERDVSTATADWTVPSDGPWFLAFDATGKQYIREVEIDLWRRSET